MRTIARLLLLAALGFGSTTTAAPALAGTPVLRVEAGPHDRRDTPVAVEIDPIPRLNPASIRLVELRPDDTRGASVPVQVDEPTPGGRWRLTWIIGGSLPAGESRRYAFAADAPDDPPWAFADGPGGTLELRHRDRLVLRYQKDAVLAPGAPEPLRRNAYIHPAFTPSGALVTGDFSRAHPHHRGFFLAYTKTEVGGAHPDFWNIHDGTGKIHFDHLGAVAAGPVVARFTTYHRWEAKGLGDVLRERWDVAAYSIPGAPYWLLDLTATQQAAETPLTLVPYRYGGMAYRGPDSFLPPDVLDVLTSAGLHRRDGDQKAARWVDLTGPVADGSADYAGALVADHPDNPHHPTVARIHPTSLPFFCFVPAHDEKLVIGPDSPTVFRYRILIHDGRPDGDLDERVWRDFAEPPVVMVEEPR